MDPPHASGARRGPRPSKRGRAPHAGGVPSAKGSAKQRARAIERLLKRDLPDEVRRAKESELASLKLEGQKAKRVQRERAFSKKYHKVKFFERQKAERAIGKLRKQLAVAAPEEQERLAAQLEEAENDLLYIRHFPRHKKYLSLFPSKPLEEEDYVAKLRAKIRARIVRLAKAGQLSQLPGDRDDRDSSNEGDLSDTLEADDFFAPEAGSDEEAKAAGSTNQDSKKRARSTKKGGDVVAQPKKKTKAR